MNGFPDNHIPQGSPCRLHSPPLPPGATTSQDEEKATKPDRQNGGWNEEEEEEPARTWSVFLHDVKVHAYIYALIIGNARLGYFELPFFLAQPSCV